jgi:membrane protein DedA with SNARE-associated domain
MANDSAEENVRNNVLSDQAYHTRQRVKRFIVGISIFDFVIVLALIGLAILSYSNQTLVKDIINTNILKFGFIGIFFANFFIELIPQYFHPIAILVPSLLIGLNAPLVMFVVAMGSFVGSVLGYEIGKKYGFGILVNFFDKKKIDKTVEFMNNHGRIAVFIAAISPVPYVPMIIGSLNMTRKNFTIFGLAPRVLSIFVVGYLVYFRVL